MLEGTYTAMITPFTPEGAVDDAGLEKLVERQIAAGVNGLVPVGTTGESPTLTFAEHRRVIERVIAIAAGRVAVIAGTGANATQEAIELTVHARDAGADATLQVTPYYNKPTQEGLFRHFSAVADLGLPVVLYNVPGRTSREIAVDTVARLAAHPHIVAVKEAGGSVDRVSAIRQRCDLTVLSGDDPLTLPMMAVGARGVVSVVSNLVPDAVVRMVRAMLAGDLPAALDLHRRYYELFCGVFLDTNPLPIKAAMAMAGLTPEVFRLPLCPMDDTLKAKLRQILDGLDLCRDGARS